MWAELRELRDDLDCGTPPREGEPVTLTIDDQPVTVPAGSSAKASLVGAKTVNGPALFRVSTNPAACTAVTRVEKSALPAATPTRVWAARW